MYFVSREFSFSYGHRLYRYDGKCSRLHGHNARVAIEIEGDSELNDQDMAIDFVRVKSTIGEWLEETFDHRVFLSKDDPLGPVLIEAGESPIFIDGNPTAERLAQTIFDQATELGLKVCRVDFWETSNCRATYCR